MRGSRNHARRFFLPPGQQTGQGAAPRNLCPRLHVFHPLFVAGAAFDFDVGCDFVFALAIAKGWHIALRAEAAATARTRR